MSQLAAYWQGITEMSGYDEQTRKAIAAANSENEKTSFNIADNVLTPGGFLIHIKKEFDSGDESDILKVVFVPEDIMAIGRHDFYTALDLYKRKNDMTKWLKGVK